MTRQFDDEENTKLRQFVTCAVVNLMRCEKIFKSETIVPIQENIEALPIQNVIYIIERKKLCYSNSYQCIWI